MKYPLKFFLSTKSYWSYLRLGLELNYDLHFGTLRLRFNRYHLKLCLLGIWVFPSVTDGSPSMADPILNRTVHGGFKSWQGGGMRVRGAWMWLRVKVWLELNSHKDILPQVWTDGAIDPQVSRRGSRRIEMPKERTKTLNERENKKKEQKGYNSLSSKEW